jgi:hypothetical protein
MIETLKTARAALERYVEVTVDDDGAITFRHGDVPCALQGLELAEGLPVLSLTCVVGWDLSDEDIPARVGLRAGEGLFGTLGATKSERGWDVTLRYAFPAAGLGEAALGTLLMLVVSNASAVRAELV